MSTVPQNVYTHSGLLADRIATRSPWPTPMPANAADTEFDVSTTSPNPIRRCPWTRWMTSFPRSKPSPASVRNDFARFLYTGVGIPPMSSSTSSKKPSGPVSASCTSRLLGTTSPHRFQATGASYERRPTALSDRRVDFVGARTSWRGTGRTPSIGRSRHSRRTGPRPAARLGRKRPGLGHPSRGGGNGRRCRHRAAALGDGRRQYP